jgi:hypothetical protein
MLGSGQTFTLTHSSQVHGHVRNPLGSTSFGATSAFSGTLWSQSFQATNSAALRLDCGPLSGSGAGSGTVVITSYTEP